MINKLLLILFLSLQSIISAQPNVILILANDQGYGDIHSHGNRMINTPNMDKIAQEGIRFENFFVSPLCAPTRASLLTGRYHIRTGTVNVSNGYETMRSEEISIAEVFKANSYQTACFGKWHNGEHYPNNANGQGFDEFLGFSAGHWGNYFNPKLEHNSESIETEGFITDVLTNKAMSWIEKQNDKPFFCYIPYNAPHAPYQVPDEYFDKYAEEGFDIKTATIYGMVENLDDNLGRLLNKVEELGLSKNTIIIFLTDNGPNTAHRYNAGMKGHKGHVDEGGVRVPMFIRWPNHLSNGKTVHHLSAHIDILPTLIDLCSLSYSPLPKFDGISLKPFLSENQLEEQNRTIFSHRFTDKKLQSKSGTARTKQYRYVFTKGEESLFDMVNDPGQEVDVKEKYPKRFKQLQSEYQTWFTDVSSDWERESVIPLGYDAFPKTVLQAVEAQLEGDLRFHGKGYAHDWIENWINKEDSIHWDIDVQESGRYQVVLQYICPEENLGSEIVIQIGKKKLTLTITEAFNPPLFPAYDRAKRAGELEKPWKRIVIGELNLKKGEKQLYLSALKKPADQVIEVRNIELLKLN